MPTSVTAENILRSIRAKIPDPVADIATDGTAFTLSTLLLWLNDSARVLCSTVPVIQDWYAVRSTTGMDTYELPAEIMAVHQVYYDLDQLSRAAEGDSIFSNKVQGNSWWYSPHSVRVIPALHVSPACDRTGLATTLTTGGGVNATATTFTLASTTDLNDTGFLLLESELVLYKNVSGLTISNVLRGQGGTVAASHAQGSAVTECNILFKCTRLPRPLAAATDTVEVPQALWPLLELYVMANVREAEQEHQVSMSLRQEFVKLVDQLASRVDVKGPTQGLQVRVAPMGPDLYFGRVYVP